MIRDNLSDIEDIEFRIERAERRDMDELAARLRHKLILRRYKFLTKLIRRKEGHEDDTYAQRARRENYEDLIEEQKAALKEDTDKFGDGFGLTIGDVTSIDGTDGHEICS